MQPRAEVDVAEVIDRSALSKFQLGIFVLCAACLIMDGFDTQSMGYVAPSLTHELGLASWQMGSIFSSALLGALFGAMFCSLLADKIGRRPMLVVTTLYFATFTLLTAWATSFNYLLIVRFFGGIGLGGIMPNAVALVGEYSARRFRATAMTLVANGYTAGAAFGGFVSAGMIPTFGWRAVFYFGAVIPLIIAALLYFFLPESLQFMAVQNRHQGRIGKFLARIDPRTPVGPAVRYTVSEQRKKGAPYIQLFTEGRAVTTILLWVVYFMNLLNLFFLSSWLPSVAKAAGYSTYTAVLIGTTLQVGGMLGSFGLGLLIDRFGFIPVLSASFAPACIGIALIGMPGLSLVLLLTVVFISGWGVIGGQSALNAMAATYYPTPLRSTGIGWGLGVGRIGAIVGPFIGGILINHHWSNQALFMAAATPALISAMVMFSLRWAPGPYFSAKELGAEVPVH